MLQLNSLKMAEVKLFADDLVEVTGTGTSKHIKVGEKITLHEIPAKRLEELGHVTIGEPVKKAAKGKGKGGKGKAAPDEDFEM